MNMMKNVSQNGDQEIKKATTMMKKCLIILLILITLSSCPTIESRRLKRGKSVVKPEVESVVKPSDGGKRRSLTRKRFVKLKALSSLLM